MTDTLAQYGLAGVVILEYFSYIYSNKKNAATFSKDINSLS